MKNGDILKCFFDGQDVEKILMTMKGPYCPSEDFQKKYPCSSQADEDGHHTCEACWRNVLDVDEGMALGVHFQNDGTSAMRNVDIIKKFCISSAKYGSLADTFAYQGLCPHKDFQDRNPCDGQRVGNKCTECWEKFLLSDDGLTLIPDPEKKENTD